MSTNKEKIQENNVDLQSLIATINELPEFVEVVPGVVSYLTLVDGTSVNAVSAALGKNNEEYIDGVGMALALYARFKDPTIDIETVFPNLIECNTLADVYNDISALQEIIDNSSLLTFVTGNSYATEVLKFVENPDMTSNTAPSGTASASSEYNNTARKAWGAFDKSTSSNVWWSSASNTSVQWVKYDFGYELIPYKLSVAPQRVASSGSVVGDCILQGSKDNETFVNLVESVNAASSATMQDFTLPLNPDGAYRYFRVYFPKPTTASYAIVGEFTIKGIRV